MDDWTTSHDRVLAQRNAGGWMFLLEAARDLRTTGAVAPSGRALARLLTDPVDEHGPRPLNVLEAGAGTGSVTRTLLHRLSPGSRLDVVEANPRFAARLRHLVRTHPSAGDRERVRVHHAYVERLDTGRRYDVIVSGLPFTNFAPAQVDAIMDRYMNLLEPGGTLTYFTYRGTRRARALTAGRAASRRHRAVEEVLADYQRRHGTGFSTVWRNLPPATVWRLRTAPPNAVRAARAAGSEANR
ncbi:MULTISPECIES: class I SAM-dependent methyltransferase [Streptomyces]|uniref:Methyltransferase domain-containing protein n=1 Tax=Streptomyces evansiae TaxID=3075535 RepID=A0ABU2R061_9ACTN|nr:MULTISPECIES: methyltransferase domain-containing protein [unclassified Streptomyces]MDT0410098.1 methyltransferase domain-containing protein [Streptomyces sp. DSM 41979]MYQ55690.1 methyltransferase domain-containing protein [Streptomyces sp. SID4926]SCE35556.1 Phospholipid N-methyltransferase [Streptomyces sp. DfronAA-171]